MATAFIFRPAWRMLYRSFQTRGLGFQAAFREGQLRGYSTYRRATMLGDWRVIGQRGVTPSMLRSLPRKQVVPRGWMGLGDPGQRQRFRYTIEFSGKHQTTGEITTKLFSIESRTQLTPEQINEAAWNRWGEERVSGDIDFYHVQLFSAREK